MKGRKVLASLENSYGDYSLHRYSGQVFKSEEEALAQAKAYVPWLKSA